MNNIALLVIAGVGTVLYMNSQKENKGEIKEHIEPVKVDDGVYKNRPHEFDVHPPTNYIGVEGHGDERRHKPHFRVPSMPGYTHKPFMPPPFVGGWNNETTFHLPY